MSTRLIFHDSPLVVAPGQQSAQQVLASYYKRLCAATETQLDELAALHERQELSTTAYRELDWYLCETLDTYHAFLTLLGYPQPQRSR